MWIRGAVLVAALVLVSGRASAQVFLNELTVKGDEFVELFNKGPGAVLLTGWRITGTPGGSFSIPGGTSILPGQYLVFDTPGDIFPNAGGEAALIDLLNARRDAVYYGQLGSAPLPGPYFPFLASIGPSLARAPDASLFAPPPPNPFQDGLYWTLDETPTFGAINDAPSPLMGHYIVLNELDPAFDSSPDQLELFNPTTNLVTISNWYVTNGDVLYVLPPATIPPIGYVAYALPHTFQIEANSLVYLFDPIGTRMDQLGILGAPMPAPGDCFGRCPNGYGPNLGFNWNSSGGFVSFFPAPCSMGAPNLGPPCLVVTSVATSGAESSRLSAHPSVIGREGCEIRWDGVTAGTATLHFDVVDVRGRVVQRLAAPGSPSGSIRWDGLWEDGLAARAGVYWVRLENTALEAARVIVVR